METLLSHVSLILLITCVKLQTCTHATDASVLFLPFCGFFFNTREHR